MAQQSRRANNSGFSRNGRFSIKNETGATKDYLIINTGSRSVYRFFNSGKNTFKVKQENTAGTGVSVEPKNSIDAEVKITGGKRGKLHIRVEDGKEVEGIYEFVETNFGVRNGRFSGNLDVTKSPAIIHGRTGSIYRIFNSGEHKFHIEYGKPVMSGGTGRIKAPVEPGESHDFVVKGVVQVSTDSNSEVPIKLIYDYMDSNKPIRSGRFKHEVLAMPAEIKHQVIDFTKYVGSNKPYHLYRIFNSGEATFEVYAQSGTNAVLKLADLAPEQSFDFGFNASGFKQKVNMVDQVNKVVWVRSIDHTKPIKGIYEYLGED